MVITIIVLLLLLQIYSPKGTFLPVTTEESSMFQNAVKIATIDSNSGVQAFMTDIQFATWPNSMTIVRESDTVMYGIFVHRTSAQLNSNSLFLTKITNNIASTNKVEIYNPPDNVAINFFVEAVFQTDTNLYIYVRAFTQFPEKYYLVTVNKANPSLDTSASELGFIPNYGETVSTFIMNTERFMIIRTGGDSFTYKLYKVSSDFKTMQYIKDVTVPSSMRGIGRIYYLESSQKYLAMGTTIAEPEGLNVMATSTDLTTWGAINDVPEIFRTAYYSLDNRFNNNIRTRIELYSPQDQYTAHPRIDIYKVELNTNACLSHTYSDWGSCTNGQRTRTLLTSTPVNCTGGVVPVLTESCTVTACTSYTYSDWGACINGQRTRTIATSTPANCTGGATPVLTESCTVAGVVCGPLDVNGDSKVSPVDLSSFLTVYGKDCSDTAPTTGCKGKDSNIDNRISPVDLSNILSVYGLNSCIR